MTNSLTKTLKDLGVALLNATLILLIALCVLILVIVRQANGLVDTISDAISLPKILATRAEDGLLSEAQRLRDKLLYLNDSIESQTLLEDSKLIADLKHQLEGLTTALERAGEECLVDVQEVADGIVLRLRQNFMTTLGSVEVQKR